MKGVKLKLNLETVNCVLLFVILAFVIYCVVKQNEQFLPYSLAKNDPIRNYKQSPNIKYQQPQPQSQLKLDNEDEHRRLYDTKVKYNNNNWMTDPPPNTSDTHIWTGENDRRLEGNGPTKVDNDTFFVWW